MTKLSLVSKNTPLAIKAHVAPVSGESNCRIMCATDLWGPSDHDLPKAFWLSEMMDAELLLLHVVDGETPLRLAGRRADHARHAVEWRVRRWPHYKPRPAVSVRVGHPHRTISRVAREWRADLVVMGPSRPRAMETFMPTTGERVAATAECAVLVVNNGAPEAYNDAAMIAKSCCQAAAMEHAALEFQLLDDHARPRRVRSLRPHPESDLVIIEADRWPAISSIFRSRAASDLARSTTADILFTPPRATLPNSSQRCPRHVGASMMQEA